ncbi:MAG: hypothetical protein FRX49_07380 [Trebouxia sp. A1-2]|nr:MAG: hypothetical protein FRX49_07380 [Trebouxia sp. A1-2]
MSLSTTSQQSPLLDSSYKQHVPSARATPSHVDGTLQKDLLNVPLVQPVVAVPLEVTHVPADTLKQNVTTKKGKEAVLRDADPVGGGKGRAAGAGQCRGRRQGSGRAGQGRACRAGQAGRAGQGMGSGRAGQGRAGQDSAGRQGMTSQAGKHTRALITSDSDSVKHHPAMPSTRINIQEGTVTAQLHSEVCLKALLEEFEELVPATASP